MDSDGYFYIVDRTKDMVNVSGYKVFPREVEEKFYTHPAVEACAVVGIKDEKRLGSEIVKLVAQLSEPYKQKPQAEGRGRADRFYQGSGGPVQGAENR